MEKENLVKNEHVLEDTKDKTIYHYVDSDKDIDFTSKEVSKKEDTFTIFPFYQNKKTNEVKQKYSKIKSFTFEEFKNILPSGFITSPEKGYGVTKQLKPLIKVIESNLDVENITISKKKKTHIDGTSLILNYKDLEKIRKQISSVLRVSYEKNKTLVNNYFSQLFPSKFENKRETYQKGTIDKILSDYEDITKNLSAEDKSVLLTLFDTVSSSKKDIFEKRKLIATREKIEKRFIEDILGEFERKLELKKINEEKWQEFFKENAWIFSQLFAYPTVLFKDRAYVGGKTIQDKDGKVVDFLYKNRLTKNSALIEVKTHTTKLLGNKPYRGTDVFHMDKELSGAIGQVLDQKETYCKKFDSLRGENDISSFNPKCIVIIGRISDVREEQSKAFELMRSSLKDVEIITFDELYARIKSILSIFKNDEDETKK